MRSSYNYQMSFPDKIPKLPDIKRPNIRAHNNPLMHSMGKTVRVISNQILALWDSGKFKAEIFEITQHKFPIQYLDPIFDGLRIVQISDIHLGTWMNSDRLAGVVELVNSQCPDLICITGDFITHLTDQIASKLAKPLKNLFAPYGTIAVLGNHDYWSNPNVVRSVLKECGIRELRNEVWMIERGSHMLFVAGLDDVYNGQDDLSSVLAQLPEEAPAIILVHVPDFADITAATGKFSLQLSGHSHGGQISLPGIGSPVLPPLGRKYYRGQYQINGMIQYTNRGVGSATLPIRYNCPPEIAVIELCSPEE